MIFSENREHFFGSCTEEREVFRPRLAEPYRIGRPAESQEAWPDAEPWATKVPLVRAAVERRQASAPEKARAGPQGAEVTEQRLSAFRFLFFFSYFLRSRADRDGTRPSTAGLYLTKIGVCGEVLSFLLAHDLIRKPVTIPDQVRDRLFRDHARAW
jgi:hypothetical protein